MSGTISAQSQEALESIDREIGALFPPKSDSDDDVDSDKDDDFTPSKRTKTKKATTRKIKAKKVAVGRKRKHEDESSEDAETIQKSPVKKQSIATEDATVQQQQPPTMQRQRSLETIIKSDPAKIIQVCKDKTNELVAQTHKDYKKIKYWLKIAGDVSNSATDKDDSFSTFVKTLLADHRRDKELSAVLDQALSSWRTL